MPELNCS